MNLSSISTKITLVFFLTFVLLIALLSFYLKFEKNQKSSIVVSSHEKVNQYIINNK